MKQASNSFTKGLMLDIHPSAVQNTQLTDALNATIITYNGNEMMLQNDMGNTLIQDSKTGHIMGLSEGFVPVGLKEHGGIMYVISANKEGVGEIGTIPSPILKLELRKEAIKQSLIEVATDAGPVSTMVGITDFKVYPGEKFLPALQLSSLMNDISSFKIQKIGPKSNWSEIIIKDRLISPVQENVGCTHTGLYELKLFSIYGSQATELKSVQRKPMHPFLKNGQQYSETNYWYYPGQITDNEQNTDETNVDVEKTWLNKGFHTYPGNLTPGRLAIKAELEKIESFDLPKISQSSASKQQGTKAPYIYQQNKDYMLAFPGFEYKTKSIRFIGELEITLTNQTTGDPKYSDTLSDFATVDISGNQDWYQIQQSNQNLYRKIEVQGEYQNNLLSYFKPLFEVNIGKELNVWYRLEVKYKDIYDGDIDTFVYSFNPYHILNFDESYYGVEWKGNTLKQQKADIDSSEDSYSSGDIVSFDGDEYCNTSSKWSSSFIGSSGSKYTIDTEGCVTIKLSDFVDSPPRDSTKSKPMKAVYTKYLYGNANLKKGSDTLQDYQYSMITASPTQYFEAKNILLYNVPNGFSELDDDGNNYGSYFWNGESNKAYLDFQFNVEEPTIEYNLPIDDPSLAHELKFYVGQQSINEKEPFTGDITLTYKFGAPVWKNDNGSWTYQPGTSTYYTDDEHKHYAEKVIFQYQVPNQSPYSLIPSFSLFGNTDEQLGLRLGLDRTGQPKEAWTFGQNLYQTCMPDKSITLTSSFEKSAKYYAKGAATKEDQTIDGVGSDLILDSGVYLITVDAGVFNSCGKYYAVNGNKPDDFDIYGCNTDWTGTNYYSESNHPVNEDPRIAVVIQDTYYQIARVDSGINDARRRTFMPTLLYLPKQSIIRMEWKYVEKLQGIGIFRVTKPIVFNNGKQFDEGDDVRVMYYQHPDLREIILPLEATYQEYALCLDKTYDYYPGMRSLSSTNHHVNMSAEGVKFCMAPDRDGTWKYNDTDPTYIWDPQGKGLMEFVYQYWQDNPLQSTEIPMIAGNNNRLEYRKLNSTT